MIKKRKKWVSQLRELAPYEERLNLASVFLYLLGISKKEREHSLSIIKSILDKYPKIKIKEVKKGKKNAVNAVNGKPIPLKKEVQIKVEFTCEDCNKKETCVLLCIDKIEEDGKLTFDVDVTGKESHLVCKDCYFRDYYEPEYEPENGPDGDFWNFIIQNGTYD